MLILCFCGVSVAEETAKTKVSPEAMANACSGAQTLSVDIGIIHVEVETVSEANGRETTVVGAGVRTGIWTENMTVEETRNPDGSLDVVTTHNRSIVGVVSTQKKEHAHIPALAEASMIAPIAAEKVVDDLIDGMMTGDATDDLAPLAFPGGSLGDLIHRIQ